MGQRQVDLAQAEKQKHINKADNITFHRKTILCLF